MKRWMFCCLCLLLSACTPYMYGVPQQTWDTMSSQERQQAMRIYEEEQRARQAAAEDRARRADMERERQAEEARIARQRIEAIHRGEGRFGELLRVSLRGGELRVGGHYRQYYQPISFKIADGESLQVPLVGKRGREGGLVVTYADRLLTVDDQGRSGGGAAHFPYDRRWERGMLYPGTVTGGPLQLRGVDVTVEIDDRPDRSGQPVIVLREEEHRPEPPPVVGQGDRRPPPPPVVVDKNLPPTPPATPGRGDGQRGPGHDDRRPLPPAGAEKAPTRIELQFQVDGTPGRGKRAAEPSSLKLADGESRNVVLQANGASLPSVVSYRQGVVIIDGSQGGPVGKVRGRVVRLPFEKDWKRGKVYQLDAGNGIFPVKFGLRIVSAGGI